MKKQDKSFEDFFRESFEGAEMTPSTHVWENISNRLDGKTRNKPFYWWSGGIAASILLLFCAYILVYNPLGENLKGVAKNGAVKNSIVLNNGAENHSSDNYKQQTQIISQNSSQNNSITKSNIIIEHSDKISDNIVSSKNIITNKIINNTNLAKTSLLQNQVNKQTNKSNFDKNSIANIVTNIATPSKDFTNEVPNNLVNDLNNDFHLLKRLSFREFPTSIKPLQVILFPLFNTTSKSDAPKVAVKIGTEIFVIGSYNSFSPNFSDVKDNVTPYPFITNDKNAAMIYDKNTIAADLMNPRMVSSYSVGFAINQAIYKGFGIRGGANYQAINYELQHTKLYFTAPSGQAQVPTTSIILQQKTALLTVPISLSYQVQTGNFICGLHAGVQTDILLQNSLTNNYYNLGNHVYSFGSYNSLNFNSLVGLRLGYMITEHFSLNMEASYRKALNSVYDTPYLQSNPQNIGAGILVGYRF